MTKLKIHLCLCESSKFSEFVVQLLIRRKRCRSYANVYFRKLVEVPGIPSHPGRLASSIVGRQQQGPLGDAYFSGMCSLGLC